MKLKQGKYRRRRKLSSDRQKTVIDRSTSLKGRQFVIRHHRIGKSEMIRKEIGTGIGGTSKKQG